ncbi:MAG: FxDxF family PEP-CTERM protein [Pseudomonadota bacterium]
MKLKNIAAVAMLAMGAGAALAAPIPVSLDSDNNLVIPGLGALVDAPTFADEFVFTLPFAANIVAGSVTSQDPDWNLTFSNVYLEKNGDPLHTHYSFAPDVPGDFTSMGLSPIQLSAGVYTWHVEGSNPSESNYAGELSVNAVPEPETYGMLLAGLGVVGFMARRRNK